MGQLKDVILTKLDIFETEKGPVYKAVGKDEDGLKKFCEAYFSFVDQGKIKGWKCHTELTCNLVCISGNVIITVCELNNSGKNVSGKKVIELSRKNYARLTIPNGVWFAIKGLEKENILLNVADQTHQKGEVIEKDLHDSIFEGIEL